MLSSGIPWNISRVTCIFFVYTRAFRRVYMQRKYKSDELNTWLKYFYTSAKKQDKKETRLQGHFTESRSEQLSTAICVRRHTVNSFPSSPMQRQTGSCLPFVKDLKLSGKIDGVAHKRVITKERLKKLYASGQLGAANSQDPAQLQRTVWSFTSGSTLAGEVWKSTRPQIRNACLKEITRWPVEYFELNRLPASVTTITDTKDESDVKFMFSVVGSSKCQVTTAKY